jgi:hypothetical protein
MWAKLSPAAERQRVRAAVMSINYTYPCQGQDKREE